MKVTGPPTVVNVSHTNTGEKLTTEEIYASWVNSTVGITTQITTNVYGQQVSGATAGSGFVISSGRLHRYQLSRH